MPVKYHMVSSKPTLGAIFIRELSDLSNNNTYWGKRFGFIKTLIQNKVETQFPAFPVKQMRSGTSNSGPHQIGVDPRSPIGQIAFKQRSAHIAMMNTTGNRVVRFNSNGRKLRHV